MNSMAVSVLAAFALCVLVVTLAMVVVPNIAWAELFEWMTMTGPSPCGCILD